MSYCDSHWLTVIWRARRSAFKELTSAVLKTLAKFSHPPFAMDPLMDAVCCALDIPRPDTWNGT